MGVRRGLPFADTFPGEPLTQGTKSDSFPKNVFFWKNEPQSFKGGKTTFKANKWKNYLQRTKSGKSTFNETIWKNDLQ